MVLHADHVGDPARLLELRGGHVAEAEVADEPLPLQVGQGLELGADRGLARVMDGADPAQVDDVQGLDAEVAKIVVHGA